ncbi:hypothetical protein EVAR_50172_1 [Eumeta japonica]|uniref:Uncharacterized protein n=1 Tax=Eumeta variegata TaxID=151549 RepID=A0A4C1YU86_EUMVA|nr:hypothetical protein EVAR_50172_1 [Eumeta japonica]
MGPQIGTGVAVVSYIYFSFEKVRPDDLSRRGAERESSRYANMLVIRTSIDKKLEKVKERSLQRTQISEELREIANKSNALSSVVLSQELELECSFSSTSSNASILEVNSKEEFVVALPKKTKSASSPCRVEPSINSISTQKVTIFGKYYRRNTTIILTSIRTQEENNLESLTTALSGENQVRDDFEEIMKLTMFALNKSPAKIYWSRNDHIDYLQSKSCVKNLRDINDIVERGVKLFEDYNATLTKNEEEKQFLPHIVEENRKMVSTETSKKEINMLMKDCD